MLTIQAVSIAMEIKPIELSGNKEKIQEFINSLSTLVFLEEDFEIYGMEDETKVIIEPLTVYDLQLVMKQAKKMGLTIK